MEDSVEDDRQDESDETERARPVEAAGDAHERSRLARARRREVRERSGHVVWASFERRAQGNDVFKGRVGAEPEVWLDCVYGVSEQHRRVAAVQPRADVAEGGEVGRALLGDGLGDQQEM